MSTTPVASQHMIRFAVWMPANKDELRALVRGGQPKRAVAEQIAKAWMMAEYEATGSSREGCAAYDEVMVECGFDPYANEGSDVR